VNSQLGRGPAFGTAAFHDQTHTLRMIRERTTPEDITKKGHSPPGQLNGLGIYRVPPPVSAREPWNVPTI
jgi:hypothetical protein